MKYSLTKTDLNFKENNLKLPHCITLKLQLETLKKKQLKITVLHNLETTT